MSCTEGRTGLLGGGKRGREEGQRPQHTERQKQRQEGASEDRQVEASTALQARLEGHPNPMRGLCWCALTCTQTGAEAHLGFSGNSSGSAS